MANLLQPTQSDVFTAMRAFLAASLPLLPENILQGQANRVPEPSDDDFIVMWPIMLNRLSTNLDTFEDVTFLGTIVDDVLTVASPLTGSLEIGDFIFGVGVLAGTKVIGVTSGEDEGETVNGNPLNVPSINEPAVPSIYKLNNLQTISFERLAAGRERILQDTDIVIQIDVHGPNAMDNSTVITALMRDDRGVDLFAATGFDVVPLYADDPKQMPFINGENQYEDRYVITAHLESGRNFTLPQQFADEVDVTFINASV